MLEKLPHYQGLLEACHFVNEGEDIGSPRNKKKDFLKRFEY
jgi:hypothetical protein